MDFQAHIVRRGGPSPAWSPDGKRITFIREGDIYVIRTPIVGSAA